MQPSQRKWSAPAVPLMPEWRPICALWDGSDAPYPSEHSARWDLRKLQGALAQAQALAIHRGRIYVHPERFARVKELAAVDSFAQRVARAAAKDGS